MAINSKPTNVDRSLIAPPETLSIEEDDLQNQQDDFLNVDIVENEEGAEVTFGEEEEVFPAGEHDDYVDTVTQALRRFREGGFIQHPEDYEQEDAQPRKRIYY